MIKYFRKLSFIKITELAFGLLAIAMVFIILAGADIFEVAAHVDLSSIDKTKIKSGMYVELRVNEILDVFADDEVQKTAYYVIPYPKTKDDKDEKVSFIALVVPNSLEDKADEILLATASNLNVTDELRLNGKISRMTDKEKKLFEKKVNEIKEDYNLPDAEILPYCYVAVELDIWDYLSEAFALLIIVVYVAMLIYIMSGANQKDVADFIKEKDLDEQTVLSEMEKGRKFGNIILSENYLSFIFKLKVYMTARESITDIYQLVKDEKEGEDTLMDNVMVIEKNDGTSFIVNMKKNDLTHFFKEWKQ